MVVDGDIIEKLKFLGLKEYEARVYATLAILGPSKASEIARESEVPRPRVYDVLKELHRKGFVDISEGSPIYFKAAEPERVIASLRDEYLKSAEDIIIKLKSYQREQRGEWLPVWSLQGEWNIKSKVEDLAERADKEFIAAFIDGKLALKFKKALETTKRKGIDVKIVLLKKNLRFPEGFGDITYIPLERVLNKKSDDFMDVLAEALFSNSTYDVKGLFIRDGEESILIYEEKGTLRGLIVKIPFIPIIQRRMMLYFIEKSREKANANF